MKNSTKAVFTTGEVARLCGVTHRTVVNWINRGTIDSYKLPGSRGDNRVTLSALLEFMQANKLPIPESLNTPADTEVNSGKTSSKSPLAKDIDRRKVLVVDDEPAMAKAIARTLQLAGYLTIVAHDGFEAGSLFATHSPDLITLDLQMPRIDGLTVLKKIKSSSQARVVVISAAKKEMLDDAMQYGADAVLPKPFENTELVTLIKSILEPN